MTTQQNNAGTGGGSNVSKPQQQDQGAEAKQALLKDIRVKWSKFTEQELGDLKSNDDLVSHVVAKYGVEKAEAQRNVDEVCAGRNI